VAEFLSEPKLKTTQLQNLLVSDQHPRGDLRIFYIVAVEVKVVSSCEPVKEYGQ